MNAKERSVGRVGLILTSALAMAATGCATHVHQRTVYVPPPVVVTPAAPVVVTPTPPPVVETLPPVSQPAPVVVVPPAPPTPVVVIRSESDFHEPLTPYGRWVVVPGYGYSWVPARVEADWRPYSDGYWQRTDAGWYWMSEEPWGWATYHYGRWDWNVQFGWFWVPQTQWAPAWVCWREGGGYVGWAPLRPSVTVAVSLTSVNYEPAFASRAFVFVEHRRMLEPVRPRTVIVNNTTIINKTVNITKVNVVNKTVINEGPRPDVIERETGRKIHSVAARDFRHREESAVAGRNRKLASDNGHKIQTPVKRDVEARPAPAPSLRQEPPVKSKPQVTQPSAPAKPVMGSSPTPTPPKRDEVVRQERRKLETPVTLREPRQSPKVEAATGRQTPNRPASRMVQKPEEVRTQSGEPRVALNPVVPVKRERSEFNVTRLVQAAADNSTGTDAKQEVGQSAKPETKPQVLKVARPTTPAPASSNKRMQESAHEKSRSSGQVEARSNERGNGREKKERD